MKKAKCPPVEFKMFKSDHFDRSDPRNQAQRTARLFTAAATAPRSSRAARLSAATASTAPRSLLLPVGSLLVGLF